MSGPSWLPQPASSEPPSSELASSEPASPGAVGTEGVAGGTTAVAGASGAAGPRPHLVVRETRWTDLARLAELEAEIFGADAWSAQSWWAELAGRPRRAYLTAVATDPHEDGAASAAGQASTVERIVGYAGVHRGGAVVDVMTIAVTPEARGAGLGRRLLRDLIRLAHEELTTAPEAILLEVRADNDAARALYDSEGFEVISTRPRYYGEVDALVMRRLLTPTTGHTVQEDHS